MASNDTIIDEIRQFLVPFMVFLLLIVDVLMVCSRSQPAPHECERLAHKLSPVHIKLGLHNTADFAKRNQDVGDGLDVLLCSRSDVGVFDGDVSWEIALGLQVLDLLRDILAVVDHVSRTHVARKALGLRSRSCGDYDR